MLRSSSRIPTAGGNPVTTDFDTFRAVVVNAGGGNDSVLIDDSVLPLVGQTATLSGGAGNDTLTYLGFNSGIYLGGSGNDTINSGRGEDTIDGGSGDDLIVRPAGSRSDRIDGGAGYDTVRALGLDTFMGGPANDNFTLSANGIRANLATTSGSGGTFVADIGTVETIDIRPGAGNDGVFVRADFAGPRQTDAPGHRSWNGRPSRRDASAIRRTPGLGFRSFRLAFLGPGKPDRRGGPPIVAPREFSPYRTGRGKKRCDSKRGVPSTWIEWLGPMPTASVRNGRSGFRGRRSAARARFQGGEIGSGTEPLRGPKLRRADAARDSGADRDGIRVAARGPASGEKTHR